MDVNGIRIGALVGLVIAAAAVLVLVGMHLGAYLVVLVVFSALVTLLLVPLQKRLLARGMRVP